MRKSIVPATVAIVPDRGRMMGRENMANPAENWTGLYCTIRRKRTKDGNEMFNWNVEDKAVVGHSRQYSQMMFVKILYSSRYCRRT